MACYYINLSNAASFDQYVHLHLNLSHLYLSMMKLKYLRRRPSMSSLGCFMSVITLNQVALRTGRYCL